MQLPSSRRHLDLQPFGFYRQAAILIYTLARPLPSTLLGPLDLMPADVGRSQLQFRIVGLGLHHLSNVHHKLVTRITATQTYVDMAKDQQKVLRARTSCRVLSLLGT